jgi:hypothetical protein
MLRDKVSELSLLCKLYSQKLNLIILILAIKDLLSRSKILKLIKWEERVYHPLSILQRLKRRTRRLWSLMVIMDKEVRWLTPNVRILSTLMIKMRTATLWTTSVKITRMLSMGNHNMNLKNTINSIMVRLNIISKSS